MIQSVVSSQIEHRKLVLDIIAASRSIASQWMHSSKHPVTLQMVIAILVEWLKWLGNLKKTLVEKQRSCDNKERNYRWLLKR